VWFSLVVSHYWDGYEFPECRVHFITTKCKGGAGGEAMIGVLHNLLLYIIESFGKWLVGTMQTKILINIII